MLPLPNVPGQVNFGSHADRVIQLAVSLVNQLTPGLARGRLLPGLTSGARLEQAEGVPRLAERLRRVFAAADRRDASDAARVVNGLLEAYRPHPYLARDDG